MENKIKFTGGDRETVWDFSRTTDEQLLRLEELLKNGDEEKAAKYSRQLINDGFLSRVN